MYPIEVIMIPDIYTIFDANYVLLVNLLTLVGPFSITPQLVIFTLVV